jgi:stearoyl-CoA desaturase (delta-9 desaturase)
MQLEGQETVDARAESREGGRPSFKWPFTLFFLAVHVAAFAAPFYFTWSAFVLMLGLNLIIGTLGTSLGYHRLLSHGSFTAPRWFERTLVTIGMLALQGAPISWSGMHRRHHQTSDTLDDPHSSARGFWWSHMGWAFWLTQNDYKGYALERVQQDGLYRFYDRHFILPNVALGLVLFAIGGWPWIFWGVFARIVVMWHSTFLVNSATHKWGYRNYDTKDNSRNTWWVAILTYGEGWHNNHHAHPKSAKFSRRFWEVDISWYVLRLFRLLRIAKNVITPRA